MKTFEKLSDLIDSTKESTCVVFFLVFFNPGSRAVSRRV